MEAAYENAYYKRSMDTKLKTRRNHETRQVLLAETKDIDIFSCDLVLRQYSDTCTTFLQEVDTINGYPTGSYLSSVHTLTDFHEICALGPRYIIAGHCFAAQIRITWQIVDQFQSRNVFKDDEEHDPTMNEIIEYFVRAVPAIINFTPDLIHRAENPVDDEAEDTYRASSRRRRTTAKPWEMPPRVWLSPGHIDAIAGTMHTDSYTAAVFANISEVLMWLNPTPHFLHSWQIPVEPKNLSNNAFHQRMRDPDIEAMSEYADHEHVRTISHERIKLLILFEPDGLDSRGTTTWS
ncbi:hypothetical protein FVE85_9446 [Porphyridium purpureum]|uniref:Uncharacterized protein n=1 Tax=Porphyridium purpureum TaxID=35688 RepID=A0A5J4YI70_PORPP|nr:hypothetical protein FVE85_9446 [Porphyridium purpureum]|eukprot:POR5445..scf261_15